MNTESSSLRSGPSVQADEEQLQSYREQERQIARLRTLQEISRKLNSRLDLKDALVNILDEALRAVDQKLIASAELDQVLSFMMASGYSMIGRVEEAVDWVEQSAQRGFINYPFLSESDPFLANLRGEPQFEALMERVKDQWETFEV